MKIDSETFGSLGVISPLGVDGDSEKVKRRVSVGLMQRSCDVGLIVITTSLEKFTRTASHVGKITQQLKDNFITQDANLML